MIVSFYNKDFKGLQNNASLVVEKKSYSLIKRPVEMNSLKCICEAFTEDIQPTFLVVQDNKGGYVYGSLAGVPLINENNQTEINGTDLKSILSSEIIIDLRANNFLTVNDYILFVFNKWNEQANRGGVATELSFKVNTTAIPITDLKPGKEEAKINVYQEIAKYLKYYNLYIESQIDLVNKKVVFEIGKTMLRNKNIKLWEYGIKDYGKWVAAVNESQGYYNDNGNLKPGTRWILNSYNQITNNEAKRDIYPVKRKVVIAENLQKANEDSLTELLNSLYNENINLNATETLADIDFETNFAIYTKRGESKYKDLPCGELVYNADGLSKFQIGYRYSGIEFIV